MPSKPLLRYLTRPRGPVNYLVSYDAKRTMSGAASAPMVAKFRGKANADS
jgi:hypothetical protein